MYTRRNNILTHTELCNYYPKLSSSTIIKQLECQIKMFSLRKYLCEFDGIQKPDLVAMKEASTINMILRSTAVQNVLVEANRANSQENTIK